MEYITNNEYIHTLQYLIRKISLINKYCLICHIPLDTKIDLYKPYICNKKICSYQYIQLGLGPSIELEILNNKNIVDLLISLFYQYINNTKILNNINNIDYLLPLNIGYYDENNEFQSINQNDINIGILNQIPSIKEMQYILEKEKSIKKYLYNINKKIYPLLR